MKTVDVKIIAIRALNHLRRDHIPSYVGLRRFLGSTGNHYFENWLSCYISNKPLTQNSQPYFPYKIYKDSDGNGNNYRECFAPSPTTSLVESQLLSVFEQMDIFKNTCNSYSYLWPDSDRCGYSYKYFLDGYRKREADITEQILQDTSRGIFVTDIKQFYPSINKEKLSKILFDHIGGEELSKEYKSFCINSISALLNDDCSGVPIGSALGHAIANIALVGMDKIFLESDSFSYYRYVDDIVVIADTEKIDIANDKIQRYLKEWGLALNENKTERFDGEHWVERRRYYRELTDIGFEDWKNEIVVFLAYNKSTYNTVEKKFKDSGFNLPFSQFKSLASYSRFKFYVKYLFENHFTKKPRLRSSCDFFIERGKSIKHRALTNLERALGSPKPVTKTESNWQKQTVKYLTNRLIYLCSLEEYGHLESLIRSRIEFKNINVLLRALISKDIAELVEYPGHTVNSFCQLFREVHANEACVLPTNLADIYAYSIHSLLIYGLAEISEVQRFSWSEDNMLLAKICSDEVPGFSGNNFSYINEMQSLMLPSIKEVSNNIMSSRFSDLEDIILDTTMLDREYS